MVYEPRTIFAIVASLLVAVLTLFMAYRVFRSYRSTLDRRLMFVLAAFLVFALKSLFIGAAVIPPHVIVAHDSIEAVGAVMDVVIVGLLFIPFVAPDPE